MSTSKSVKLCVLCMCLFMRLLQASAVFLSPPEQRLLKPSPHTQCWLRTWPRHHLGQTNKKTGKRKEDRKTIVPTFRGTVKMISDASLFSQESFGRIRENLFSPWFMKCGWHLQPHWAQRASSNVRIVVTKQTIKSCYLLVDLLCKGLWRFKDSASICQRGKGSTC